MTFRASVVFAGAFSVFCFAALSAQDPPRKASIEGVIAQVGTGAPLAGARVTLSSTTPRGGSGITPAELLNPSSEMQDAITRMQQLGMSPEEISRQIATARGRGPTLPPPIPAATADDKGRFSFSNLDPGTYRLQVQANGYVPQDYGQRYSGGPGTPITLEAGQAKTDIAMNLTPAGNISGRLRDTAEQPLSNVPVQLLRATYNANGDRSLRTVGSSRTDDRGEFRIYWVTPGRYYIKAGTTGSPMEAMRAMGGDRSVGGPNLNEALPTVATAFFPGVPDVSGARVVEVPPGADVSGVDWMLPPQPAGHRVRGKLVDSRSSQPPKQAMTVIVPVLPGMNADYDEVFNSGFMELRQYNPSTGFLEYRNLKPGVYEITAIIEEPPQRNDRGEVPESESGYQPRIVSGSVTVAVAESDVDDVVLPVAPPGSLSGHVRIEGSFPTPARGGRPPLSVRLNPARSNAVAALVGGAFATALNADGVFRMNNVSPGEYRVVVQMPTGFVKSAQLDGVDVLDSPLVMSGNGSGNLEIVVSANSGQVEGNLTDERSEPVPMTQVVLVPNRSRGRADLYKTAVTDSTGHFSMTGVAPGDYKAFAWQSIEPFSWFDPEVMERSDSRGSPVHVSESSFESVEVRIIPAGGGQ